ncbi:FAD/NAD(P)-binding domain-containing protein [Pholiota conissans]|uniref:FAD/NAD(P)-binding domain-containing protein n=1 Tax=Pholiota conissans TaxID=109636 RepID=A0A9P6D7G1_9AGAR|nr:FAD/NAD(P)-binding domain-containing protein [Pholiota conissans]
MSFMNMQARVARNGLKHSTRVLIPATRHFSSSIPRSKQRVIILGSGWGGYNVLRGINKKDYDVVVISPNTYFNFTPLLASTAVGTLEFRCAIEPVRKYAPGVTFYQAWCDEIDFQNKRLKCMPATRPPEAEPTGDTDAPVQVQPANSFPLHYDKLIIAVGAYSQTFDIPGVKEHAHFLKDVKDARKIRGRIFECFEQANQPFVSDVERRNLLNFCIVGGGPTGIEFSAELHDLIHTDVAKHYPALARLCKVTIYDVAPQILGSFDKSLRNYTEKTLSREGIRILTNHHVERVEKRKMIVKEIGEVPFGLLVWSTGLAPNPVVKATTVVKKNPKTSSFLTNDHLNIIMDNNEANPDVWAIGDAAQVVDAPLPATAQVAAQKAKYIVKKVNKLVKEQDSPEPFSFENRGSLAYIGNWKAIYDRSKSPSDEGFLKKETGRTAWLLWRSAYFTMALSTRNKILIPAYWFLNWIFGRDLTRF